MDNYTMFDILLRENYFLLKYWYMEAVTINWGVEVSSNIEPLTCQCSLVSNLTLK